LQELAVVSPNDQGYSLHEGLIWLKGKVWVGANATSQTKIIQAFHSSALGGHSGIQANFQKLKKLFCWTSMKQAVESFIKQCQICQQAKHETYKSLGLLCPLPVPHSSWQDVSMDFIDGLLSSTGYLVIMVVVDRFTKYGHFYPLKHPYTAVSVASVFLDNVVKLHGLPKSIVSDRDKVFTTTFWKTLFGLLNIKLQFSSAYHPQMDGQTERVNQCLEMYLQCAIISTPNQWVKWPPLAELWYNSSYHSSLKCSPFRALYGVDPVLTAVRGPLTIDNEEVSVTLEEMQHFSELLKEQLARVQNMMKIDADHKRSPRQF
jgi:hypothetical protein